jgi:GntR family transcriptional regulator
LPSVRQFARDLDVAPNTIVRAYSELELEWAGWVVTSMRKGVVTVVPHPPILTAEERQQRLKQAVSELLVTTHQLDVSAENVHAEIDWQWSTMREMQSETDLFLRLLQGWQ